MENYLDTLFDQSNELYLKYINNYISIKRLKKVIHQLKLMGEPDTEINPQGSGNIKWKSKN